MRACAVLEAERAHGRTHLTTLRSDPPLTLRATPDGVHLVGSAAGPLGGDDLGLRVTVGTGAELEVRSAAASVALPGPKGERSTLSIDVQVRAGGELRWLLEPTVAARGCDHRVVSVVELSEGATLVWREEVILGRIGEGPGSVLQRLQVDRGGRPLLRHDLALGPRWPWSDGPAGMAGARAVGALLWVAPQAAQLDPPVPAGVRGGTTSVGEGATLFLALADSPRLLRQAMDAATARATDRNPHPRDP